MGRERAAKIGLALDRIFACFLFAGCIGLSVQIFTQNKSLELLQDKYEQDAQSEYQSVGFEKEKNDRSDKGRSNDKGRGR